MTASQRQPSDSRRPIFYAIQSTRWGWVLAAASEAGICAIEFGDLPEALEEKLAERFHAAERLKDAPAFRDRFTQVIAFLENLSGRLDVPLDIQGTTFQRRVWEALQEIPRGETVTYADVANRIGMPKAVRAVAQACASNHLAVVIPCHRVIRSNGELGGYRWGLDRKRALLDQEMKSG